MSVIEIEHEEKHSYNNNVNLSYDKNKPPHIKVYKCPFLDCRKIYFSDDDKEHHLILDHYEIPKKMSVELDLHVEAGKNFSRKEMQKLGMMLTRQSIKSWMLMIGAVNQDRKRRVKAHREKRLKQKDESKPIQEKTVEKAQVPKKSLWQRIFKK